MRTYLIDSENNEHIIDLTKTIKHTSELFEFRYSTIQDKKIIDEKNVFVRKLANNYYASFDKKAWKRLARQELPKQILNVDRVFSVYRGYKPSGLSDSAAGELRTQMPGKVVKILIGEGDSVEQGQTLLILEAMKMENEIKAGMSGVVKSIEVKEGDTLENGVLMIELEG